MGKTLKIQFERKVINNLSSGFFFVFDFNIFTWNRISAQFVACLYMYIVLQRLYSTHRKEKQMTNIYMIIITIIQLFYGSEKHRHIHILVCEKAAMKCSMFWSKITVSRNTSNDQHVIAVKCTKVPKIHCKL